MNRWIVRILVCLILGAVTTVAVAWLIASVVDPIEPSAINVYSLALDIPGQPGAGRSTTPYLVFRTDLFGTSIISLMEEQEEDVLTAMRGWPSVTVINQSPPSWVYPPFRQEAVGTVARGWPCLALRHAFFESHGVTISPWEVRDGILVSPEPDPMLLWALPLRPIWFGIVIDTLFYAAIWGGVWFGFVAGKRAIRRKRGRCPMCGYDLRRALEKGCSECGWQREGVAP
jgi:hypothetical protein